MNENENNELLNYIWNTGLIQLSNFNYSNNNPFHNGIKLALLCIYKNDPIKPFYPVQFYKEQYDDYNSCLHHIDDDMMKKLFESFATIECGAMRPERQIELIKNDVHPPSKFRVNCTVMHCPDFYDAYRLQPSDKMYLSPENRIHIW